MGRLIYLDNEDLANYVMFKLDKLENGFVDDELDTIKEVVIDYDELDDKVSSFYDDLLKLKNIETITIRNGYIKNREYNVLLNLEKLSDITFDNCSFEEDKLLVALNLKSLSLINCGFKKYYFLEILNDLKELTITNGNDIDTEVINSLANLRYLQLSYSNIVGEDPICINGLEELYIDNTNITNFDFLNKLIHLKRLSIDIKQYSDNKDFFDNLINKGISVYNENMVLFGGDDNGI